ncbi:hypothetical protein KK103_09550 [Curtobacterium flaccumfaciens pv. flaccumfaciens]|uniref:Uncharacterized protein n=1 Tax=Curtobacterium flaccumfaciens pv. flaccumfaciens TaxID=138532 RepID=A0A9Q2W346_9MICO|nr:hypothetical protein [Curtobacterium flaccumfaciens]MBT1542006.1 hypothetical protein [Curtobacterium flaccumfaciens pv. flaccumfaciens]
MHNLDAYWSVLAQIALVLGFALVTELRRMAGKWKYEDRVTRRIEGVTYLVLAVAIIFLLFLSLNALAGVAFADFWVTVASLVTGFLGTVLILNPVALIATSGNADLILIARGILPWSSPSRGRRELKRMTREVTKMMRETVSDLKGTQGMREVLGFMTTGESITAEQFNLAVPVVADVLGESPEKARAFLRGVTGDAVLPQEVRDTTGKIRDAVVATGARQLAALNRLSVVRREIIKTRVKHGWRRLPPKAEAELKKRFEASQREITAIDADS